MPGLEKLTVGARALSIELRPQARERFEAYFQELVVWNQRLNLTTVTSYEEVQLKHFLDSLSLVLAFAGLPPTRLNLLDVGTGAGFPGLPLKIVFPTWEVTLLEATTKKARFLEHLIVRLGLAEARVVVGRAETVAHDPDFREGFGLVASRAVAPLPTLVELTLPFCRVGGRVVAFKKGDMSAELAQAEGGLARLGGHLAQMIPVNVTGLAEEDHRLVVIDKIAPTPIAYPRRPGIPAKRPLRGHV